MITRIKSWIPLAIAITGLCGLVFISVQQNYRQSANDPQIQMAEDAISSFAHGQKPLINQTKVDMEKSLAPFLIIYDDSGKVSTSGSILENEDPIAPPAGVFEIVRTRGKEWFTWQPKSNTRIAAVLMRYPEGFVLAGRNLREVENRERWLEIKIAIVWAITMGTTLLATLIFKK